jgi:hypothetical protein
MAKPRSLTDSVLRLPVYYSGKIFRRPWRSPFPNAFNGTRPVHQPAPTQGGRVVAFNFFDFNSGPAMRCFSRRVARDYWSVNAIYWCDGGPVFPAPPLHQRQFDGVEGENGKTDTPRSDRRSGENQL